MKNISLIVCDLQPDVVRKLQPQHSSQFLDLVDLAVRAARNSQTASIDLFHTMLKFPDQPGCYDQIPSSHPKLGILRTLQSKNPQMKRFFTSPELCIPATKSETVLIRGTFLPQASDKNMLEALRKSIKISIEDHEFILLGYGPTVQCMCNLLGDVLGAPNVRLIQECIRDENVKRCESFLDHGFFFREEVISLVDFIESMDLLHERIDDLPTPLDIDVDPKEHLTAAQKYVCDCGRSGHLSIFIYYLVRDHGYVEWPVQPWYQDVTKQGKQYWCPLGRHVVDLCDEPQFSFQTRFFLSGREWLDEKNLLHTLVPDLMPPTFHTLNDAQDYCDCIETDSNDLIWFLKKVNQNGGRAVHVRKGLPAQSLEVDEQLQVHIPRPLLFSKTEQLDYKCHVKTYQWIGIMHDAADTICWHLYMHDLYYLATANHPWQEDNLSDAVQITTMRTHRLYRDHPWRIQWDLTKKCQANMEIILRRAIEQGKLRCHLPHKASVDACKKTKASKAALKFEIMSADWMLDEDGNIFLIECNGLPVLYDPAVSQPLTTKGLKLYDSLYKENPKEAVVNDHDLLKEAIGLAVTGKLPSTSLWNHITTIPIP